MAFCLDMDDVVASAARAIQGFLNKMPEGGLCTYGWILNDGTCMELEDDCHYDVLPEKVRGMIEKAIPGVSVVDFSYWVMGHYFKAIRFGPERVSAMEHKRATMKQVKTLESYVLGYKGMGKRVAVYMDISSDEMPVTRHGLRTVESFVLPADDSEAIREMRRAFRKHGIYP